MVWDNDAINAPHTQREMEIEPMQWNVHDDGYIWAQGRKARYEISEGFGNQRGMMRLNVSGRVAFFCGIESAKDFAEEMDK